MDAQLISLVLDLNFYYDISAYINKHPILKKASDFFDKVVLHA